VIRAVQCGDKSQMHLLILYNFYLFIYLHMAPLFYEDMQICLQLSFVRVMKSVCSHLHFLCLSLSHCHVTEISVTFQVV